MIYTDSNLKYCMAAPLEFFVQWRDELAAEGFRPISISLAGPISKPIYSAVMVKRSFRTNSFPSLTKDQLSAKIDELAGAARPLHPYLVAATGSGSNVLYAASFREMSRAPRVRLNMFPSSYQSENEEQRVAGRILIWVDAFGTPEDIRYCAIWADNPDMIGWNVEALNDKGDTRQQRYEALNSINVRPALTAMTPAAGAARLFVDTRLKHRWHSQTDMSGNGFSEALDVQERAGRFPIQIGTTVANNEVRYSAIFAESDEILPRAFRIRGPDPIGLDAANRTKARDLDDYMENYVRAHNLRGAAIAIVEGTKLVYAKGYTFAEAEPHYEDIEPTTLFRLASISKTYCAVAIWALLQEVGFGRGTTMQSVVDLKQPNGSAPADPDFASVTIRHLLESNSGIDQNGVYDAISGRRDGSGSQPLTVAEVASAIAARDMPGTPGGRHSNGKQASVYGNTDYFLLGLVAAKKTGLPTFEAALKKLVLDPLHMTRTRGDRSLIEDQPANHAHQHYTPSHATWRSAMHDDRRLVPWQYGTLNHEVLDGKGGLSAAVIDVARLCAMLSCRLRNPVLRASTIDSMLADAVAATASGSAWGYHGFDGASGSAPNFLVSKGGALTAVRTHFHGRIGGRFAVIFRNGENVASALLSPEVDLYGIAGTIDWGGDLFPHFGMPALGLQARPKPGPVGRG